MNSLYSSGKISPVARYFWSLKSEFLWGILNQNRNEKQIYLWAVVGTFACGLETHADA